MRFILILSIVAELGADQEPILYIIYFLISHDAYPKIVLPPRLEYILLTHEKGSHKVISTLSNKVLK